MLGWLKLWMDLNSGLISNSSKYYNYAQSVSTLGVPGTVLSASLVQLTDSS